MSISRQTAERLANEHGGRLYTFCRRLAFSQTDADDLYQQTFLRIMDMSGTIDLEYNPAGFLMSVAARIWRDERTKYARRQRIAAMQYAHIELHTVPVDQSTEALVSQKQVQADVRSAVEHLSDTLRVPVLLYYMADLSINEISKALQIPQGTVKRRLYEARHILRSQMEGMGYDG